MRRLTLRAAGLLVTALAAITCTDATTAPGSRTPSTAHLSLAPSFSAAATRSFATLAAVGESVTDVHIVLRTTEGVQVSDVTVPFPAGQDTVHVEVPVQIIGTEQSFSALLELRDASGVVLFSQTQLVTARAAGLPAAPPPIIVLEYVGPGHDARAVAVSPATATLSAGVAQVVTATATDSAGRALGALIVGWTSSDTTIATVAGTGPASARVTGTGRRGAVTITATTPTGIAGVARFTALPQATALVVVSGDAQTGVAGHAVAQPLVLELRGLDNGPIPNALVVIKPVTAGGVVGTLPGDTLRTTDSTGRVSVALTVGRTAGTYGFQARSGALTAPAITAIATQSPAIALALVAGDAQRAAAGHTLPAPFTVRATDEFGAPVPATLVTFTRLSGRGAATAATATTDSLGLARMSYVLGGTPGTDSVRASLSGVTPPAGTVVFTATTVAGAPARLAWQVAPPDTIVVGTPFPAISARLTDSLGNATRVAGVTVRVRGVSPSASDSAFVDSLVTDSAGVVHVALPTYVGVAGQLTLTLSGTGLDSLVAHITARAGSAARLGIVSGIPARTASGAAFATPVVVHVTDAGGNPVAVRGLAVTARIASGSGSLSNATATTDSTGVATFGGLSVTGPVGPVSLSFDASGYTSAVSTAIAVDAGAPGVLAIVTYPSPAAQSGVPFVREAVLQLQDGAGNPVSATGVSVSVAITSGNGSLVGVTAQGTDASGRVTFTGLGINGLAGPYVLTFSATGLTPATAPVQLSAGVAASIVATAGDGQSGGRGALVAVAPRVVVRDSSGNPVTGAPVLFTAVTPGDSVASTGALARSVTVTTDSLGAAALSAWKLGTTGHDTVTASVGGIGATFAATGGTGAATHFALVSGAAQSGLVTSLLPGRFVIEAQDANGVPVPNVSVRVDRTGDQGYIELDGIDYHCDCTRPDSVLTDSAGRAAFTWHLGDRAKVDSVFVHNAQLPMLLVTATALAGPATRLVFVAPSGLDDDVGNVQSPFQVVFTDAGGIDTVTTMNGPVTLSYAYQYCTDGTCDTVNPRTSTLTVTAVNGVATFDNVQFTETGTFQYLATAGTLTGSSDYFDISPVGTHFAEVTTHPAGVPHDSTVTIQVRSQTAHGDVIPNSPIAVTVSGGLVHLAGSRNAPSAHDSATTDASGLATLTWTMPSTVSSYLQLTVGNDSTPLPLQIYLASVAGPPTQLVVQAQSLDATPNATLPGVTLQLTDAQENFAYVNGPAVTVSLVGGDPTAVLHGTLSQPMSYGFATFGNLSVDKPGTYRLHFTEGTLVAESGDFTIAPLSTNTLSVAKGARAVMTPGSTIPADSVVFLLKDANGQPAAGVAVDIYAPQPQACAVVSRSITTSAAGLASVAITAGAETGGCVVRATSGNAGASATAMVAVVPPGATHAWFGDSVATDYHAPANWLVLTNAPRGVPGTGDAAYIPCWGNLQSIPGFTAGLPKLQRGVSLGSLIVDRYVSFDLGGFDVTTTGNIAVGAAAQLNNGSVLAGGSGADVTGVIDRLIVGRAGQCASDSASLHTITANYLRVDCTATVGDAVYATTVTAGTGTRIVLADDNAQLYAADTLSITGASLTVRGFVGSGNAGTITPQSTVVASGQVNVSGVLMLGRVGGTLSVARGATVYSGTDAHFGGGGTSDGDLVIGGSAYFGGDAFTLPSGELVVSGNVEQAAGSPTAFQAGSAHSTYFVGSAAQAVRFASPAQSYLNNVNDYNTAAQVSFGDGTVVNGSVDLPPTASLLLQGATMRGVAAINGTLSLLGANVFSASPSALVLLSNSVLNIPAGASVTGACTRPGAQPDGVAINGTGLINGQTANALSCGGQ